MAPMVSRRPRAELGRALALGALLVACAPPDGDWTESGPPASTGGGEATGESESEGPHPTAGGASTTGAESSTTGAESETDLGTATETSTSGSGGECPPPPCEACTCDDGELVCACVDYVAEAGFVELPGAAYVLGQGAGIALKSSDTRLFWAFQPAEVTPESAPIFVFFNGGPGVSSGMLMGLSTGRSTFAPGLTGPDHEVVDNPYAWTELGNLLWIDARQTGFSYGLLEDPGDQAARDGAMSVSSFNSYRDAADVALVLLELLGERPGLQDNEIILVGESYGGIRAQIILDMMLHPGAYADGERRFRDEALAQAITDHHDEVHGGPAGPQLVATQFRRQVLIQPSLAGTVQRAMAGAMFEAPGSVIELLAQELGVDYPSCADKGGACNPYFNALNFVEAQGRSIYDYRAPQSWLDDLFGLVALRLNDAGATGALLGVELAAIPAFLAGERGPAWRAVNAAVHPLDSVIGDWPELAGELELWDRYFVPFNPEIIQEFRSFTAQSRGVDTIDPHYGELFLRNLVYVDTMITQAAYDLAIYSEAIPATLADYTDLVEGVVVDGGGEAWSVEYRDDVLGGPGTRVIAAPRFEASHAVTYDAPELRDAVAAWLEG